VHKVTTIHLHKAFDRNGATICCDIPWPDTNGANACALDAAILLALLEEVMPCGTIQHLHDLLDAEDQEE
jgi:hypothetical protein